MNLNQLLIIIDKPDVGTKLLNSVIWLLCMANNVKNKVKDKDTDVE